jgi:protein disulfide-isomerase
VGLDARGPLARRSGLPIESEVLPMRKLLALLICSAVGSAFAPAQDEAATWLRDLAAAKTAAGEGGKPILLHFLPAEANPTVDKLKAEVFEKPEFATWAAASVVLVVADLAAADAAEKTASEKLAKDFGVRNFPQVLLLDAEGKKLGQLGYKPGGAKAWTAQADKLLAAQKGAAKANYEWLTNYEEALERAKKEKKPILADFTGSDWCGWCIKLKGEVFDQPEFQKWAVENVVLLELDFPRKKELPKELADQNAKLRDKHGIRGYPTILFLDAKGEKIGQSGYVEGGPAAWIKAAEEQIGGKKKKR